MIEAINGIYDAASIDRPRHIVFVPSPLAGQIAAGFAAAIWHLRDHPEAAEAAAQWRVAKAATILVIVRFDGDFCDLPQDGGRNV